MPFTLTTGVSGDRAMETRVIPVSGALCVELARPFVLVMVTKAVRVVAAIGVNETCRVQLAPAARVAVGGGQELTRLKSSVSGPVNPTLVRVTGEVPGLATLIVWAALVVPVACELKMRLGGVRVRVVACEAAGGLAMTMPNGVVSGTVAVTVFVDV